MHRDQPDLGLRDPGVMLIGYHEGEDGRGPKALAGLYWPFGIGLDKVNTDGSKYAEDMLGHSTKAELESYVFAAQSVITAAELFK